MSSTRALRRKSQDPTRQRRQLRDLAPPGPAFDDPRDPVAGGDGAESAPVRRRTPRSTARGGPALIPAMKVKLLSLAVLLTLTLASGAEPAAKTKAPVPPSGGKPVRSTESLERKARSIAKLKEEEIPTTPDWPVLPDSTTAKVRTTKEVAERTIAICFTALKAEGADQDTIEGLIQRYKAKKFFTPAEWEFVDNNAQTNDERNKYLWRYEDLRVLMWALGYDDEMDRPDRTCDVRKTVSYLSNRSLDT